ncbi:ComEC/Rec2 family competence protein [Paenibacillus mendelii]|uniref:ComEC/Rec2 family competence protein n=1 Tax=Paenibacillus mendelii TaxID=206163 RepID=A0ABV6JHU7_9BACL|nr:ComEC/Rec2 family competence protein [Paenibacillus mendelii]MCQ6558373.1 ComEC/Rec2 family competence protein [Paenibacillus mendelii]
MTRRPIVLFTICWIIGSAAAAGLTNRGILLAGGALAAALLAMAMRRREAWPLAAACLAAFGVAAGERMWADARNVTALQDLLAAAAAAVPSASPAVEAEGTIISAVEIDGDRVQFRVTAHTVRVEGEQAPRKLSAERLLVQVRLEEQPDQAVAARWQRGDRVRVAGVLELPAVATNFGGFDYRRYLSGQRMHGLLKAKGVASVQTAAGPALSKASLLGRIDAIRDALGSRMEDMYPAEQAGYMKGLVLGIREDLDPDRFRQFSQLGLTHILAISGLHVAVFLYVLGGLLKLLRMTRERLLLVMIVAVPLYVLLAGGSPSVIRAGIMAMLGLTAARLGKLKDGLHLLAAAALLMLVYDPYLLEDVGFQLSFIVTAGLIIGVQPVRRRMPESKRWKALYDLAAVTIVAQAVSFPLTVYYFNQFHLLSLPANFALVPFISFIVMPLGGASLLLADIWHPAASLLAKGAEIGNDLTFGFVLRLSEVDRFRFIWAKPPLWWVVVIYAALGLIVFCLNRRSAAPPNPEQEDAAVQNLIEDTQPLLGSGASFNLRGHGDGFPTAGDGRDSKARASRLLRHSTAAGAIVTLLLPLLWAYHPDWNNRDALVSFIDVGQGDSILVRTAEGKHLLIDGGGIVSFRKKGDEWKNRRDPFEVGRKTVVPLLQQRGVQAIDLLVISHLDSDHIRGLHAIISSIPVKRILWNGTFKASDDARTLLLTAVVRGIPLYRADEGQRWEIDGSTRMTVIGSSDEEWFKAVEGTGDMMPDVPHVEEQNGQSVAFLLHLYDRTFLFAGDADAKEERTLIERADRVNHQQLQHKQQLAPIDVMKVSHHGSKTSTTAEWLAYWQPKTAVISVGRTNVYGHPNADVLTRLHNAGTQILRTDRDGEVQIRVTGKNGMLIRTMLHNPNES